MTNVLCARRPRSRSSASCARHGSTAPKVKPSDPRERKRGCRKIYPYGTCCIVCSTLRAVLYCGFSVRSVLRLRNCEWRYIRAKFERRAMGTRAPDTRYDLMMRAAVPAMILDNMDMRLRAFCPKINTWQSAWPYVAMALCATSTTFVVAPPCSCFLLCGLQVWSLSTRMCYMYNTSSVVRSSTTGGRNFVSGTGTSMTYWQKTERTIIITYVRRSPSEFFVWGPFFRRRPCAAMWGGHAVVLCLAATRACLLYTSPSPRDKRQSRMPSSA